MTVADLKLSVELQCLAAFRQARADFFNQVVSACEASRTPSEGAELTREERKLIRGEGVAHLAELFFTISEVQISSSDDIRDFLVRHNEDMQRMLSECQRGYTRFGLSASRLKEAIFKDHQIDMILHESSNGTITFDQRSVGKILTQVMSFESCRTLLLLLAEGGLITRRDFRSVVLISPNGRLEALYKDHLTQVVASVSKVLEF